MDHLNQTTTETTMPATIAQAFAEWQALQVEILAALGADAPCQEAYDRSWAVENHAITLPAITAEDVWALVAMTSDENNLGPRSTQDQVVTRAYAEVAALQGEMDALMDARPATDTALPTDPASMEAEFASVVSDMTGAQFDCFIEGISRDYVEVAAKP